MIYLCSFWNSINNIKKLMEKQIVVILLLFLICHPVEILDDIDMTNPQSGILLTVLQQYYNAPVVDSIYGIIVSQDYYRQRLAHSQILLLEMEQQFDIYELQIINSIRQNIQNERLLQQKLNKHFIPKRSCLDTIVDYLRELAGFTIEPFTHSTINSYLYARDQLQFRSQCYSRLIAFKDEDIDLMSANEIEMHELINEFTNDSWSEISKLMKIMDYSKVYWGQLDLWEQDPDFMESQMKRWLLKAQKGVQALNEYFFPLQEMSRSNEKEFPELFRKRRRLLKINPTSQRSREIPKIANLIQLGRFEIRIRDLQIIQGASGLSAKILRSKIFKFQKKFLSKEQAIKAKLMKEVDKETQDLLEKTSRLSESFFLEQIEQHDKKVKFVQVIFDRSISSEIKTQRGNFWHQN